MLHRSRPSNVTVDPSVVGEGRALGAFMRTVVFVGVACAALAGGAAKAADMTPVPGAPAATPLYAKMPMMAAYDWTGIYVGGHASFDWAKTDITTTNTATGVVDGSASTSRSSAHGGGQIGFDYMMLTRVVIGFAADISTGDDITPTFSNTAGTNVH